MSREFPKVPVAEVEAAKLMVAHQAAQQACHRTVAMCEAVNPP